SAFEQAGEHARPLLARVLALQRDPRALEVAKALPASEEQAVLVLEAQLATDGGRAIDGLRIIERARKTPELELRIAQALLRDERAVEAAAQFRRARAAKASERECLAGEGEALLLAGRLLEGAHALEEAAKLAPRGSFDRARLLARRARVQFLAGLEPSREALAERPDDPLLRLVVAGDDAATLEKLANELATRPEAVQAWCALARLHEKKGDAEAARVARSK